jgi:hypothetical protein
MTLFKPGSPATQESTQNSPEVCVKVWTEILRHVDNHPGIGITEITELLRKNDSASHRLMVSGYIHCMLDIGLLRREGGARGHYYTNGSSFVSVVNEFVMFKQMLDVKRQRMQEAKTTGQRAATKRLQDDDEGYDE